MPKLIDDTGGGGVPIGEEGVLHFIDELNEKRARLGFAQRYQPVRVEGKLTGEYHTVPFEDRFKPSRRYAKPIHALPHWQDREHEPA